MATPIKPVIEHNEPERPAEDDPVADISNVMVMLFSVLGMMRYKYAAWAATLIGIYAMCNGRYSTFNYKQSLMSLVVAAIGLFVNYFAAVPEPAA